MSIPDSSYISNIVLELVGLCLKNSFEFAGELPFAGDTRPLLSSWPFGAYCAGEGLSRFVGFLKGDFETSLWIKLFLVTFDPNLLSVGPLII